MASFATPTAPSRCRALDAGEVGGDRPTKGGLVAEATAARFHAGDPDAVRAVYRAYGGLVFAAAYRILGDRELAEDAAQQAFVQAWRAARSFDPSRDLGNWLYAIARRCAIDVYRREARRNERSIAELSATEQAQLTVNDNADRAYDVWTVRQAVDALPAEERAVVRLQHLEGLTHAAIAARLCIPVGTVKSRSSRAHRRLAGRLGHLREAG